MVILLMVYLARVHSGMVWLFFAVLLCFGLPEPVIKSNFRCTKFTMDVNYRFEWMKENSKETYKEVVQCMEINCYGARIVRGTTFSSPVILLWNNFKHIVRLRTKSKLCKSQQNKIGK